MKKARKFIIPIVTILVALASFSGSLGLLNTQMLIGWLKPDTGVTWIWFAVAFALMCFLFVTTVVSGRCRGSEAFLRFVRVLLIGAFCVGIAWLAFLLSKNITEPKMSELLFLTVLLVVLAVFGVQYSLGSKRSAKQASSNSLRRSASGAGAIRYDYSSFFGSAILASLMIAAGLLTGYEVKSLLVIYSLTAIAFFLWRLTGWRGWLMVSAACIVALLCCNIDDMHYSLKQLPYITALLWSVFALTLPLIDLYGRSENNL